MNFIPNLTPVHTSLKGVDVSQSVDVIQADPMIFQKMATEVGGHGWASNYSTSDINDPRWGKPYIYPGVGSIDWKRLEGNQYVFVFTGPDLKDGFWHPRSFFDDVKKEGWIRSKNYKYYAIENMPVPDAGWEPWILKFDRIMRTVHPIGWPMFEAYSKVSKDVIEDIREDVKEAAKGIGNWAIYAGVVVIAIILLTRK